MDYEKEQEKMEKERELAEQQAKADLTVLLGMPEGIRFFKRFFEYGRLYSTSFTGKSESTIFNEGKRNLALWVLNDIINTDHRALTEILVTKPEK